ncbi:GGDEF domain-containing protein [Oceanospirillum sediminis]|uniref:diguanylate cyclase n=1 Tax=Oceanospirillum sediminis TaxID=2760088 RepID=A0A839IN55_9GAMM|nr:GGDEF domain-containing protein [Oceanospirillum sediminis]MBB1486378.1 GGDEF domain-containing protein [Oceanospirillum sediminis]
MSDAGPHSEISSISEMQKQTITHGNIWILASGTLILAIVLSFLLRYEKEAIGLSVFHFLPPVLLLTGAGMLMQGYRNQKRQTLFWMLASTMIAMFWLALAWSIFDLWDNRQAAEKVVLIGFFSVLIGWYSRYSLLLLAIGILISGYAWFLLNDDRLVLIDQLISLVKFPILILLMTCTLRRLYNQLLQKQIENDLLISELREMSYTDTLTGLINRKGFNETLRDNLKNADRFHTPLSLIILDIDHFKQYNDSLGHPKGDLCLKKVAAVLASQSQRAVDTVARIGGEEFALILPGSNSKQASQLAEMIREALMEEAITHPDSPVSEHVTVSMGIANYSEDDESSLYRKADSALYKAKSRDRNRSEIFSLLDTSVTAD